MMPERKYLDLFRPQLFNVNAGHQHPKVIAAIKEQADKLCYIGPGPANRTRAELCRMLAEITPGDLNQEFFFPREVPQLTKMSMKIAKAYTGRPKIISRWRSYHGADLRSHVHHRKIREGFPTSRGFQNRRRIWDPFCYRCFFDKTYPECNLFCADQIT